MQHKRLRMTRSCAAEEDGGSPIQVEMFVRRALNCTIFVRDQFDENCIAGFAGVAAPAGS
jgi:hypothetical protein